MSVAAESEVVRRMLDDGHLTHVDEDGHARELFGNCPADRSTASVHRVSRAGNRIVEVVLRCPICGQDFTAGADALHLR